MRSHSLLAVGLLVTATPFAVGTARRLAQCRPHNGLASTRVACTVLEEDGDRALLIDLASGRSTPLLPTVSAINDLQWAPDGSRMAVLLSIGDEPNRIAIFSGDGRSLLAHTEPAVTDHSPRWSPDGTRLAFISRRFGPQALCVMTANGQDQRPLTRRARGCDSPAWSPDGTRLAFSAALGDSVEVWVVNAAGGGERPLTRTPGMDAYPAWSPDGKRIAFAGAAPRGRAIYTIATDGSGRRRLATGLGGMPAPAWSPDGSRLAFYGGTAPDREVWVVHANGAGRKRLPTGTVTPMGIAAPWWLPDGRYLLFAGREVTGPTALYTLDTETGHLTRVTAPLTISTNPCLLPAPPNIPTPSGARLGTSLTIPPNQLPQATGTLPRDLQRRRDATLLPARGRTPHPGCHPVALVSRAATPAAGTWHKPSDLHHRRERQRRQRPAARYRDRPTKAALPLPLRPARSAAIPRRIPLRRGAVDR
jgi:Tol biopolymer transport system component